MSIIERISDCFSTAKEVPPNHFSNEQILSVIDLTCLEDQLGCQPIQALQKQGEKSKVAALCIYPKHIPCLSFPKKLPLATVVNFPDGNDTLSTCKTDILRCIESRSVDEIDYVFPYKAYLDGNTSYALTHARSCYEICAERGRTFKVIIESGALPSLDITYQLSLELINSGCDFIKTSTGKISQGSTLESACTMLLAIKDSNKTCGLKVSGGVRDKRTAVDFIHLAETIVSQPVDPSWFRIGASQLLQELI